MIKSSASYKRVVVKIGSSILSYGSQFDIAALKSLVGQVSTLLEKGIEVILVSSGAVSSGMSILGLDRRPNKISELQACASIGQGLLMQNYTSAFLEKEKKCAQLLLTWDDFSDRGRYLNVKNTLFSLLSYGAVPIINENDTVSSEEIKFGDNDNLSALVAILVKADLLIILSDVEGLLDEKGVRIPLVREITPQIRKLTSGTKKAISRGGMLTKLDAAEKAANSGIPCLIASGAAKDVLNRIVVDKENLGTVFLPCQKGICGRKGWIAYSARSAGKIFVDDGAKEALIKRQKSLLSVGIQKIEGSFVKGDIVSILDREEKEFARGSVSCGSKELEIVKGKKHSFEIIHRNNLAII
ncbi:MAG: glutamate 5-kinase [Candidatus Omnitrophota bacterium]